MDLSLPAECHQSKSGCTGLFAPWRCEPSGSGRSLRTKKKKKRRKCECTMTLKGKIVHIVQCACFHLVRVPKQPENLA